MLKKFQFTKKNKEKDKIDKLIKNKSNSDKLDIIINVIQHIQMDLSDLKQDFNKYKKQDSDFHEARINNFIISKLQNNITTYFTKLLSIKNIYLPDSNKILSDFDGLIYYTPKQIKMANVPVELSERTDKTFQLSLKNNISKLDTTNTSSYLIIVESKRSLNKQKVDMKLQQIYKFMKVLSSINTLDLSTTSDKFKELINQIQNESGLSIEDLSNIKILLIFGSDDISNHLYNYILQIGDGINEEEYNKLVGEIFLNDEYAIKYINNIIQSTLIPKIIKSKLKHYKTFNELKDIIKLHFRDYDKEYITDYLTSYDDLKTIFEELKGKIGITQFNNLEMPHFLNFS